MSSDEQLTLYATPSTHIRADLPPTRRPYHKIVGVQLGGRAIWAYGITPDDHATTLSYGLHPIPARRLYQYFEWQYGSAVDAESIDAMRNCFHFGIWMVRGALLPSRREASRLAFDEARYTPPVENEAVGVGELSVIRPLQDRPAEPVMHCMVKIDADASQYIQVMTRGGDLGVTTAEDMLSYRRTPEYREQIVQGRYHLDPATWDVGHFSVSAALQPDYLS